jgi:hypothetical protein
VKTNTAKILRRWLCLSSLAACLPLTGAAAEKKAGDPAQPAPPNPFVLFMGADLSVQQGKRYYRVKDVDGSEFVITVGNKDQFVRTRLQSNHIKVDYELKLAAVSAKLDDLQGEPGYTPAADPRHKYNARSGAAAGAQAVSELSTAQYAEASAAANLAPAGSYMQGALTTMADNAKSQMDLSNYQRGTDFGSIPTQANELSLELAEGNYDMIDVSFRVSSPEVLDDPYMVVLVEFQPRNSKPGESSQLIHATALDPIGPDPKYIRVREGGMPVGFKILHYEVHIYNRGKEVATNASNKRVELSRDEARQYLVYEYLAANKDASRPASALPGSLPPAARSRLTGEQLQSTCYVRVAADGTFLGVYRDEAANLQLSDEQLKAVLADAFFKPALVKGKAVEGVARVRPVDLIL